MAVYAIKAYESSYGGLHGMCSHAIHICETEKEACEIGEQMSYEVMGDYAEIYEGIENDADNYCEDRTSDKWYQYLEEIQQERVQYEIHELNMNKKYFEEHRSDLEHDFWYSEEDFLEKWKKKEE